MNKFLACLIIALVLLTQSGDHRAFAQEEPLLLLEPQNTGTIEGSGTSFVITDSQYLNLTLESSQPVQAVLESVPTLVTLHLAAATQATSTVITLGGFTPSTTYYLYQDDYHHLIEFTTDANGQYQYTQDLTQPHLIFIQPVPSTVFINSATGGDCTQIGTWDGATNTCTLTGTVTEMIQIDSNGITLNGNNNLIQVSSGQLGIYLRNRTGIMIENVRIDGASTGIYLRNVSETTVRNTTILNSSNYSVRLDGSSDNTFAGNSMSGTPRAFRLENNSSRNRIQENTIVSTYAVFVINSTENTIADNTISSSATGPGGSAGIGVNSSPGTLMIGNTISDADTGIFIAKPFSHLPGNENSVMGNTISNARIGITLNSSSTNTVSNNTVSNSSQIGIYIYEGSNSNIVADNQLLNNHMGVRLFNSSQNQLTGNAIADSSFYGILFNNASNSNHVTGNVISGSGSSGIRFHQSSNGNVISDNTITDNYRAIDLTGFAPNASNDNQVYHNNFIDNTYPPQILAGSGNIFNLSAPLGGNYWSQYDTAAEGCEDTNHDRFCDAPYTFYGGQDNLPWTLQDGWTNQPPVASAGGPYNGSEGGAIQLSSAYASDPDGDPLIYTWDVASTLCSLDDPSLLQPLLVCTDNGSFSVELIVSDGTSAETVTADVTVNNVAPVVSAIAAQPDPPVVSIDGTVDTSVDFTDAGTADTHTALWDWGDGRSSSGTLTEIDGSGTATGSHVYATSGVYTIKVTITDDDSGVGEATYQYAVVYDPSGGFITGGGGIDSQAGAYPAAPSLIGKTNFGFVAKYKQNTGELKGETQYQFKAADINFHSENYEWLVFVGSKATYQGTGSVNGIDGYGFLVSAIDSQYADDGEPDRFRIKIWNLDSGDVVYDTQPGADLAADPTTPLARGNVALHQVGAAGVDSQPMSVVGDPPADLLARLIGQSDDDNHMKLYLPVTIVP